MATVAIGTREGLAVRSTVDRVLLREFLERDRLFAAYAICDLAEREFPRTRWGVARSGDEVVSVAMEYSGLTPQPMFVMGHPDGIAAVLKDVVRPRAAYVAAKADSLPAVAQHYKVEAGPEMIRMWVDRATFSPVTAHVERLLPVETHDLNRLYQLGFAAWLPSSAIAEGVYYGIRVNGRLVAAAGTHVVSREAGLAVVGNVLTHADHRGRGYAKAATSAVTAELLRYCDQVVLNVRVDNPPAIAAYRRLGYQDHSRFEERLVRRTTPTWPDLAASFRRLFASRRSGPKEPPVVAQAHPTRPIVAQAHPSDPPPVSPETDAPAEEPT
ncbi:MAG TPA: GNAT family N-acetyltransferase [Candidatus Limnocylindrales bacterium]|nr:GNAT family N-acetyltransferase [Candidatus Limnocylindrales bacterium]